MIQELSWIRGMHMETKKKEKKRNSSSFLATLFRTKKVSALGLVLLVCFVLIAIFADVIAPYKMVNSTMPIDILNKLKAPSLLHPLGTDNLGKDVLSYMIYGCRTSVILGIVCTILSSAISLVIGVTSAVIGGWFDLILQRIVDAWQCVPGMLIMLILMAIFGNGLMQLILVISIPAGIGGSRMVRSSAITVKDSGYAKMSGMLGCNKVWIMIKHVTPNVMPIIIMNMANSLGGVIMMEASMNFLGFGVSVNTPSWGAMLTAQGRAYMYQAPWLALAPGIAITIMIFASAMLGDGVRDILDPRLKGGVGSYSSEKIRKIVEKMQENTPA